MKMASRKKNMPSTPNGNPSTAPYWRISPGHSRPISNDSTVPGHRADRDQHPHGL